ncbi:MAG: ammonium transporter [Pseudomonadota bacterium]|nr:ammonium transporter [Pseudomonadota bacterium]
MRQTFQYIVTFLIPALILISIPNYASAQEMLSNGDTAWIITATALVLFMTLPGLALFYGGLVRSTNVLSVLMQCFGIATLASILWLIVGYSIAFGQENAIWGGLGKIFLMNVPVDALSGTIPENVFFLFQLTFAIITPALIVGAYVERIKFSSVLLFSGLWLLIVYAPSVHWIWGGGFLTDLGWAHNSLRNVATMDFAGGLVVHANAGIAALVVAKVLGSRKGFPGELRPPHNPGLVMIGSAMLWVGWFGFNGGSALAANGGTGQAIVVTHISAASACLVWMAIEWIKFGKPSLVGIATGAIAGLATITPGSGFVGPVGAIVYGAMAGLICFFMISVVKSAWNIDDSLDVFAVHGVGGILGTLLASIFVSSELGGAGYPEGVSFGTAFAGQLLATVITVIWAAFASLIIIYFVRATTGLRVSDSDELEGLDLTFHGEKGYDI